jgi:hypothetical protein
MVIRWVITVNSKRQVNSMSHRDKETARHRDWCRKKKLGQAWFDPEVYMDIQEAAQIRGQTMADFLRQAAQQTALRIRRSRRSALTQASA